MNVEVVTPYEVLWSGEASSVVAPALEGDLGILPGRQPVLAILRPGNVRVTHRSLFDGTNQGIELLDAPAFSFQGHPEASPGPQDVAPLFDRFIALMAG